MSKSATEQAPEKSKFARKCNLLSQYLKQNGSFGGIDLGLTRKPDSDLGFAGKSDPTGQQTATSKSETSEIKPIDFIQMLCGAVPSESSGGKAKDASFSEPASVPEPGTSQLTIFFAGKVIVFNEFPADKAKEIMEMAKQANPGTFPSVAVGSESVAEDNSKNHLKDNNNSNSNSYNNVNNIIIISSSNNNNSSSSKSNLVIPDLNEPTSSGNTTNHQTRQQNQLVERIARRASLHRFFAKRKDRAAARAPYQVNQNAGHPPKPEMVSPSLERGQSSGQANNCVATAPLLKPKVLKDKSLEEEKEEEGQCLKDLELRL